MAESFTSKQKEIVARKMGYDGPMQMFDEFLSASPSDAQKYSAITSKFVERMAKGGMVKKMADGGVVTTTQDIGGPKLTGTPTYTAAQTTTVPVIGAPVAPAATTAGMVPVTTTEGVTAPTPVAAPTTTGATAAPAVTTALGAVQPEQGVVGEKAQITAATQEPTTTAVGGVQAAQGTAAQIAAAPTRVEQAGEMITGPAVDMGKVEQTLAQTQAAQGVVTEEMTTQGQLNKLLQNFDAGAPPPWAAATMRTATAQLAARGLGASSLAGQAVIQAALEAATPIAAADAKVFEQMGLTNLSNRQQIAVLTGQQRAQFLGQEFDQAFQTRVLNAAKVADIANKNFDAQTTIAIENARLTNTMNVSNLSAKNALVLANAAQIAQLETQNLNNRQVAAVENAKAFLQMDVRNLELRQQTALFKAQEISDALVSDAGFENAARITNANNAMEAAKISATLALTADQFNATERNKVNLYNANAANELARFNALEINDRAEFNSKMSAEINIANAKILADISTANTAAINAANAVNAKNATDLTAAAYAQQSQTYRDLLEMSWKTGEQEKDRVTNIAVASITKSAAASAAQITADANSSAAWGSLAFKAVENWDKVESFGDKVLGWFS